jgi:hypothetical protein
MPTLERRGQTPCGKAGRPAAKRPASGVCPGRRAGFKPQESAPADSCLASKENAPSRSRLRPANPIDLRRSDCRAGEPSTSGAPCSVHSETYWCICPASSALSRQCVANCDIRVLTAIAGMVPRKNAVATATAGVFRDVPRRRRGSSRGIWPLPNPAWRANKMHRVGGSLVRPPNRPPPKRLPVGGPSTSGAPSSVQSGHYGAVHATSSRNRSRNPQFAIFSLHAAQDCASTLVL